MKIINEKRVLMTLVITPRKCLSLSEKISEIFFEYFEIKPFYSISNFNFLNLKFSVNEKRAEILFLFSFKWTALKCNSSQNESLSNLKSNTVLRNFVDVFPVSSWRNFSQVAFVISEQAIHVMRSWHHLSWVTSANFCSISSVIFFQNCHQMMYSEWGFFWGFLLNSNQHDLPIYDKMNVIPNIFV